MTPRLSSLDREPALANLVASVHAALPLPELRRLLHEAGASFDLRYRGGEPVRLLVSERAAFMDLIVDAVWRRFPGMTGSPCSPWAATAAVSCTPLRHRCPDPHQPAQPQRYAENVSAFIAALWDLQLKVGHSVRTLGECKAAARADITVATNLMETRTIAGNARIEREMQERTSPSRIWPSAQFFRAKRDEQRERHERHGNTEYNLEPNIKEAPGGLRDIQTIHWMALRHFGVRSLESSPMATCSRARNSSSCARPRNSSGGCATGCT